MRVILSGLSREIDAQLLLTSLQRHLALLGNGNLRPEAFQQLQDRAHELFLQYLHQLRPEGPQQQRREYESLREAYVREIGDPSDPQVIARILKTLEDPAEAATAKVDPAYLRSALSRVNQPARG